MNSRISKSKKVYPLLFVLLTSFYLSPIFSQHPDLIADGEVSDLFNTCEPDGDDYLPTGTCNSIMGSTVNTFNTTEFCFIFKQEQDGQLEISFLASENLIPPAVVILEGDDLGCFAGETADAGDDEVELSEFYPGGNVTWQICVGGEDSAMNQCGAFDYVATFEADFDCPSLEGNEGDACDDNDVCTINDAIDNDCNCVGEFQDADDDDICDALDNCPNVPNPDQENNDEDAEGDLCDDDDDNDGVLDDDDNCPMVFNPDQADEDNDDVGDVCESVSTIDHAFDHLIDLYPNPAVDYVNIKMKGINHISQIEIFDVKGKLIDWVNEKFTSKLAQVNITQLTNGIYFTKMLLDNGDVVVKKFYVLK